VVGAGDLVEKLELTKKVSGIFLDVLYEDDHMAVVLKPPGMKMHGRGQHTVERAIQRSLQPSSTAGCSPIAPTTLSQDHEDEWQEPAASSSDCAVLEEDLHIFKPQHVHRLDAATGGVVVAAKTRAALVSLSYAFANREVEGVWDVEDVQGWEGSAVVVGRLEGANGEIDAKIGDQDAYTTYCVLQHTQSLKHGWLTKVELYPYTGRKHQLRRHLAGIGHPILGDPLYGALVMATHCRSVESLATSGSN
ncbi:hypothetical protein CYMTET_36266, partial [Cymbomonas tetramitiformis]